MERVVAARRNGEPLRGLRVVLIAALLGLAAVAWFATDVRMSGMDAGPGTGPGTLGFWTGAWVVMMAAMMFPSIVPMVLAHAYIQDARRGRGHAIAPATTATFVAGYLVTWTVCGLAAYAVYALVASLDLVFLQWTRGGRYLDGGVLLAAAAYQLTPAKDACLRRCRSPMDFVLGHFREGHSGALRMGVEHGLWCVGCCWALMAALFALGVMNVGWMVFVAGLVAVEKLVPWRAAANRGIVIVLAVLGLAVAVVPQRVPGLTLPDSPAATRAMNAMQGMRATPAPAFKSGMTGMPKSQ